MICPDCEKNIEDCTCEWPEDPFADGEFLLPEGQDFDPTIYEDEF